MMVNRKVNLIFRSQMTKLQQSDNYRGNNDGLTVTEETQRMTNSDGGHRAALITDQQRPLSVA